MAVSLETRVPFLVRQLLYRNVPRELVDRPKDGFGIPVGQWLKGPLREWAEDLLDVDRIRSQGWFDPDLVQQRWRSHLSGREDSTAALWAILMFQAWLETQRTPISEASASQAALAG